MKERGILFSPAMVQAERDGRKNQTRLTMKKNIPVRDQIINGKRYLKPAGWPLMSVNEFIQRFSPYGQPGDILWVRETFAPWGDGTYAYKADGFQARNGGWERDTPNKFHDEERIEKWKPALFMPREASRTDLVIKSIRVERLQDISQEDAEAEGVTHAPHRCPGWKDKRKEIRDCFRCAYRVLWNQINGPKGNGWGTNPWVWVIDFVRG